MQVPAFIQILNFDEEGPKKFFKYGCPRSPKNMERRGEKSELRARPNVLCCARLREI